MSMSIAALQAKVASQKTAIPAMYGNIDFTLRPERFVGAEEGTEGFAKNMQQQRSRAIANPELMARMEAYTMLGDTVADAYAALMPQYGFRGLVTMLVDACEKGVETVEDAPPELVHFLRAMEETPDWLDMKLVEEGARQERGQHVHVAPFVIRGAFIATFMNKYAALPMALTGTLSHKTAARRVKETATFFATSTMPGALERFGAGFKAAAMVRLMHSMVRFNVLSRDRWDQSVYGIPIPQVDQMPAGLITSYLMSVKVLEKGRNHFTSAERAGIELARYRCFLLGLPEELLADTPQGIVDNWLTRHVTMRAGYDDATCGGLLRATMGATLVNDQTLPNRLFERYERSFSKIYFMQNFMEGDAQRSASVGVPITPIDRARAVAVMGAILSKRIPYKIADRIPGLRQIADRRLVRKLGKHLHSLGQAEFTSNAENYRPATTAQSAA